MDFDEILWEVGSDYILVAIWMTVWIQEFFRRIYVANRIKSVQFARWQHCLANVYGVPTLMF